MVQENPRAERAIDFIVEVVAIVIKVGLVAFLMYQVYAFVAPHGVHIDRLWDKNTRLKPFEREIVTIADEFMRRSPRLRALVQRYNDCPVACREAILLERDEIVRQEWPDMYKRLRIYSDWTDSMRQKSYSFEKLLEIVEDYGDEAWIRCIPKISIHYAKPSGAYAHFEKFVCIP